MLPKSNTAGSTSSAVSVAFGVILGAALTFGMQLHANHVQDRRIAHQTRAQHIERLMIATEGITTASFSFALKVLGAASKRASGQIPSVENMMPELGPAAELRAVCALYLPEVDAEVQSVSQAYLAICKGILATVPPFVATYKAGDPVPAAEQLVDKKLTAELTQATRALETKLIELAKKNRQ